MPAISYSCQLRCHFGTTPPGRMLADFSAAAGLGQSNRIAELIGIFDALWRDGGMRLLNCFSLSRIYFERFEDGCLLRGGLDRARWV